VVYRVLHPPYCYRWAVLISIQVVIVWLVTSALHPQSGDAGMQIRSDNPGPAASALRAPDAGVSITLVRRTAHTGRVVALTFDDGPSPAYTPEVLALLAKYHATATFCMVGSQVARYPDLVREVVSAGMNLCDHTLTHAENLSALPDSRIKAEILGGRSEILRAVGRPVTIAFFRAPAGRWSTAVRHIAARHGMKPLSWSVDPRDWSRPGTERIVAGIKRGVHPGAVILLHDGGGRRDQTVAALSQLLPWLIEQGYRFDVPG
jgi:peptidoglycan-N-acetylglucosamine deacetylase